MKRNFKTKETREVSWLQNSLNFVEIESKWQKKWEKSKIFNVKENKKEKFYVLEMYPYPSGSDLHMGHAFNYTIGDIYARFKRMQGFNVLYPMGYDSFGLPAENAAIQEKIHPKKFTEKSINHFIKQQKEFGLSYDWSRIIETHKPEYYKWNQFFFLKFLEKGLVYRKKAPVNWCPKCNTVLANEQVHRGKCWRHPDTDVEIKQLEQWFIKTTDYVEELLDMVDNLKWPDKIKVMQKNWIGKSQGTEIDFEVEGKKWSVFTTRPDTIYGVTFMVISAQHPRLTEFVKKEQKKEVETFLKKIKSVSEKDKEEFEKEGVFTGSYAVNPINEGKVPVYAGNFVVVDYGSGMVMAVPAHDQRDFEFSVKYDIPVKVVIEPKDFEIYSRKGQLPRAYTGEGTLVNSGKFNGIGSKKAIEKITKHLEKKKLGRKLLQYKMRDWLISRQRYWGTPIPVVYCEKCGIVPVPEKELPVILPEKVKFGKGNPLKTNKSFLETKCPQCKEKARRETDTLDTFFDSSWYYLRYCDSKNKRVAFDKKKIGYWMPVNQYIGGAEHACMHLLYARFFTKALRDLGFLEFDEPFIKLFNQGMLHGSDGFVMSKSKGNTISPEKISEKYGIDTARLFLISIASPDKDIQWSEKGIEGSFRFISRIMNYFKDLKFGKADARTESKLNKTIKEVTTDIEDFRYNLAVIKIREFFSVLPDSTGKDVIEKFLRILHPFCPHITEEFWQQIGNKSFISLEKWPVTDEKKIDQNLERQEQEVENLIKDINHVKEIIKIRPKKSFVYVLPGEKAYVENLDTIKKRTGLDILIYSVNDKGKYDPENKSKKVKPGKPGIYLE
ncbi:MAG TPA: leucine--tRNA ligase [Candidatus Pacearchaeota archaeon]|nr:leucine--tRNA ligase [Candidatus Pacearchaeota archaeon]